MQKREDFSIQEIPPQPGVYIFRNRSGQVIYVGKAKVLRKRLASYFQASRNRTADPKLRSLINSISFFEYSVVNNEAEALLLESRLIKQYGPRYNVELTDDKRYLLICIDPREKFPRLKLARLKRDDHRLYFGPFPHASSMRATVDFLSRRYGLRTCKVANPDENTCKHCMDSAIRNCSCPCLGKISESDYGERVEKVVEILRGHVDTLLEELAEEMKKFAGRQQYELAARRRDILANLRAVCQFGALRTFERRTLGNGQGGKKQSHEQAVKELSQTLGLAKPARVIEGFDISNIGGRMAVASMVCFVDGKPNSSRYRRFRIRGVEGSDDYAMIREVITRRCKRLLDKDSEFPDLFVIDGGAGQLSVALKAMRELDFPPLPVLGLAKKQEEIFLPGRAEPLALPRHHLGLRLLQAIRDEAHRFALAYHHKLRRQRLADSILMEMEGIGKNRAERLLKTFGGIGQLRKATSGEIADAVPGLGKKKAQDIVDFLAQS